MSILTSNKCHGHRSSIHSQFTVTLECEAAASSVGIQNCHKKKTLNLNAINMTLVADYLPIEFRDQI